MLNARVRVAGVWGDVCILDISTRGLLLQSSDPPARGAYLAILRGHQSIVGRVIWVQGQRFGLRTQDALPIDEIINPPEASKLVLKRAVAAGTSVDADNKGEPFITFEVNQTELC